MLFICLIFNFQAYDQPDSYETSDLPESEQNVEFSEVINIRLIKYTHSESAVTSL